MNICYLKSLNKKQDMLKEKQLKFSKVIRSIIILAKSICNNSKIEEYDNNIIYTIFLEEERKWFYQYRLKKITKKLIKKLEERDINTVVLSNQAEQITFLKNSLYSNNLNILDGRKLFKILLNETLEYVADQKQELLQNEEIAILTNNNSDIHIDTIILLANKVKRIKIVTNHIDKFKKIEEMLYEKHGIPISISNNKSKSLQTADIIVNLDFPEELINQFKINKDAVILNIEDKVPIYAKSFAGININYYKIKLNQELKEYFIKNQLSEQFDENILYESILPKKDTLEQYRKRVGKDEIEIEYLIGNNGKVRENEYKLLKSEKKYDNITHKNNRHPIKKQSI